MNISLFRMFICFLLYPLLLFGSPSNWEDSALPSNPSPTISLSGVYDLGGGNNDFNSFAEVIAELALDGISGPTTIVVYPGTYNESLTIPAFTGGSPSAWLEFVSSHPDSTVIIASAGANNTGVVTFTGASFVRFDGISVTCLGEDGQRALVFENGCSNIEIRNGSIRGSGTTLATSYAIECRAVPNSSLVLENLSVRHAADAIHFSSSSASGQDSRITNCVIDSVYRGVYLDHQQRFVVEDCDIKVNAGSSEEIDGVYIGTLSASDTVSIRRNHIHEFVTSNSRAIAVKITTGTAVSLVRVYNNFVYGFANTAGSQIRAIDWASGMGELYSNSIYMNDVSATGGSYGLYYSNFNPSIIPKLRNNIFFNNVQSGTACCVFIQSGAVSIDSDYNIFHGTGTGYFLGKCNNTIRQDLVSWQACGGDVQSLEGDPQFSGESDLHLAESGGLAHQNGSPISYIATDIDQDLRGQPPDRGADEYGFAAPPADFAVLELLDFCSLCPELSNVTVDAVIQNRGSAAQADVPIRLSYQDTPRAEILVSLLPLETDTFTIIWSTAFAPSEGELKIEAMLPDDPNQEDNYQMVSIAILGQPLHGDYHLGGQNADFMTFNEAMQALGDRGMSDTVAFNIASGTYNESVVIPQIIGIAADRPIIFRKSVDTEGPVKLLCGSGPATLILDGARFVTLNDISIEAAAPNGVALLLDHGACYNTVHHVSIKSFSPSDIATVGVRVTGGGCHGNSFEELTVSDCYHGFRLDGSSADPDSSTIIESCTISNSVRSIFLLRQKGCKILRNVILPGYDGSTYDSYGVYVASLLLGDSALVEGNIVSGGRGEADAYGIFSSTGAGSAMIYNNFVADWKVTGGGSVFGIQVGSGTARVYHNSIRMSAIPGTAHVYGLAINGAATVMDARNNAVEIDECDSRAFCWRYQNGILESDHNAYYSPCQSDSISFALFLADSVYETLTEWSEIRALDVNGIYTNPGFESATDLHIKSFVSALDGAGESLADVTTDIDGGLRGNPPDIGADEYIYTLPALDYAVSWSVEPATQYSALTEYQFAVMVNNFGGEDQLDVPVQLLFNDVVQSELLVSLLAGSSSEVFLSWTAPDAELSGGLLSIRSVLTGDLIPLNDRADLAVIIAGPPLIGTYHIGGGTSDFSSLGQAVQALETRGILGDVTIELFPGSYYETVSISEIPGAAGFAQVTIQPADGDTASVAIRSLTGSAVLTLNGTDYLNLEGINLFAEGSCKGALEIGQNCSHNYFGRALLRGPDSLNYESFGAQIKIRNCDNNHLDRVLVSGAYSGVALKTTEVGFQAHNTLIENCTILNARYGIYVDDQVDCMIRNNDIIPGSPSSLSAVCYGIFVTHLNDGGSVEISGNRIHGFADASGSATNRAVGVYSSPGAGGVVTVYNNFIYDFSAVQSLKISGIYLSIGESAVYNNSILIGDTPSSNEISGVLIFAGSANDIRNNIIVCNEPDVVSRGIYALAGSAEISDYNNLYSASPLFHAGAVGLTEYITLEDWRATGFDLNSVALDPHFLASGNLHLDNSFPEFDNLGDAAVPVTVDIDGELRHNPPDIGADEFTYVYTPDPPQSLTLAVDNGTLILRWEPSVGALSYRIYEGDSFDFTPEPFNRIATTSNTFLVHPISEGYQKYYLVKADSTPPPAE